MGRRKRCRDDEYDDSVERAFASIHESKGEKEKRKNEAMNSASTSTSNTGTTSEKDPNKPNTQEKSNEELERLRLKKKAKKERQKQKKLEAKQQAMEEAEAKKKQEEEKKEARKERQKQKKLEKTEPPTNTFIKTHKNVKYCDIVIGKGPIIEDRKKVRVKYTLRAETKFGKIIDSGSNFSFKMGKNEVIPGWEIGLLRMRQGGIRHIIVPPKAGYGNRDIGGGPGANLYFEVTLLQC